VIPVREKNSVSIWHVADASREKAHSPFVAPGLKLASQSQCICSMLWGMARGAGIRGVLSLKGAKRDRFMRRGVCKGGLLMNKEKSRRLGHLRTDRERGKRGEELRVSLWMKHRTKFKTRSIHRKEKGRAARYRKPTWGRIILLSTRARSLEGTKKQSVRRKKKRR